MPTLVLMESQDQKGQVAPMFDHLELTNAVVPLTILSASHDANARTKFPNCLCSISTRQLELLLRRAGLTAQHLQDCPTFFIQLNYVHKSKKNKVQPLYVKLPCHKVALGIPLSLPLIH